MKKRTLLITIAAFAFGVMPSLHAQQPRLVLTMRDGYVTLVARDVPIADILREWARVGQTRIDNGDRVQGARLTLQLTDVSEREALDTVLRSAAGYIAVARPLTRPGLSTFDRVAILATSHAAPANAPAPSSAVATGAAPGYRSAPGYATTPASQPATVETPPEPDDADTNGNEIFVSMEGAQPVPAQQPAVSPMHGLQPQIEAAQPHGVTLTELLQNTPGGGMQQGTPTGPPGTSAVPGVAVTRRPPQ